MNKLETSTDASDELLLLRQYVLGELSEADSNLLEERFADDQAVFHTVLIVENSLIDEYVQNQMPLRERQLFEQNYLTSSEKREKVQTAHALQDYLQSQSAAQKVEQKISVRSKIYELFNAPAAWRMATAALVVMLALGAGLWLIDRTRLNNRLAELHTEQNSNLAERELNSQLEAARQREAELKNRLDERETQSNSLSGELDNERKIRERLEDEIEKIRRANQSPRNNPLTPELAAVTLRPAPGNGEMTTSASLNQHVAVTNNLEDLSVKLILPQTAKSDGRFSVEFNRMPIASNLAPRLDSNGTKVLRFVLSAKNISRSLNGEASLIAVRDSEKNVVSEYPIEFKTQP